MTTITTMIETEMELDIEASSSRSSFLSRIKHNVRRFRQEDQNQIRQIYLDAQRSIIKAAFVAGIQKPFITIPALFLTRLVAAVTSVWLALIGLGLIVSAVYISYYLKFMQHINHALETDLADISKSYSVEKSSFWVVERNNEVAGFVGVVHRDTSTIELQRLTVAPEYRRQGIAESLCRYVIALYAEMKLLRLRLECTESHDAAKNLYRKLGFTLTDCVTDPYALSAVTLEHHSINLT
ncbi:N-acetyltransferase family 8 member 2 [Nematostella vectensis]|nr:N-acetyltransferase family 8 member 2 [Nematostella vectensis]